MEQLEQEILSFIRNVYEAMGWPGVVALMAVESASIPLPSEIIMPLAGWMLIRDQGLGVHYVLLAGFYGALGCALGSAVAYWVGIKGGAPFSIDMADTSLSLVMISIALSGGSASMARGRLFTPGCCPWCAPSSACRRAQPG